MIEGTLTVLMIGFSKGPLPTLPVFSATMTTAVAVSFAFTLGIHAPTFVRPGTDSGIFYYHAKIVSVTVSGTYTFSISASFQAYWFLYRGSFDPKNPNNNLHAQGYHGGGSLAAQFSTYLEASTSKRRKRVCSCCFHIWSSHSSHVFF